LENFVSVPEREGPSWLRHRTAATAATLALAAATLAVGATTAQAYVSVPAGGGSANALVWATTVSGRAVPVAKPTFIPTPVHPEKLTHPGRDFAGSTVHFAGSMIRPDSVPQLPGIDVSGYQGDINWGSVAPHIDFSYAKATEGTYYTNPDFYNQYEGPYDYGVIRGSYHFAIPNNSSGEAQANYFVAHGGGWSSDGKTLPGALDIEYNPYGSECYGLSYTQMVDWLWDFVNQYAYREHVYPVIYTTTDWWSSCTGNYGGFGKYDPLWIANYSASGGGPLPSGWGFYTFWQYRDSGSLPGDQDVFNGAYSRLQALAKAG
jgi:GH25 family lysozyme M1 (1,4-beta-N-acetylmuramidase)